MPVYTMKVLFIVVNEISCSCAMDLEWMESCNHGLFEDTILEYACNEWGKSCEAISKGQPVLWLRLKECTFWTQVRSPISWENLLNFSTFSVKGKVMDVYMCKKKSSRRQHYKDVLKKHQTNSQAQNTSMVYRPEGNNWKALTKQNPVHITLKHITRSFFL